MTKMTVALVGSGKTGQHVSNLHHSVEVFDSKRTPTLDALQKCNVIISFLPGPAFKSYIPLFIESTLPVVIGSTGIEFGKELERELKTKKLKWIWASNFSLGMNLIHQMILTLSKTEKLFNDYSFNIHEIHHTQKQDAPSGTALTWKEWLGHAGAHTTITYERDGDTVGFHHLSLKTSHEEISLNHKAMDRSIFAQGALWAAKKILTDPNICFGLNKFSEITRKELLE